jgi:hypothetical protein
MTENYLWLGFLEFWSSFFSFCFIVCRHDTRWFHERSRVPQKRLFASVSSATPGVLVAVTAAVLRSLQGHMHGARLDFAVTRNRAQFIVRT